MRILFAAAPAYGLLLPIVPLVWAARAAGRRLQTIRCPHGAWWIIGRVEDYLSRP